MTTSTAEADDRDRTVRRVIVIEGLANVAVVVTKLAVGLSTGGSVEVRHCRITTSVFDYYVSGTAGTVEMSHTYVDAAGTSFSGTATCSATAGPGTFTATGCP